MTHSSEAGAPEVSVVIPCYRGGDRLGPGPDLPKLRDRAGGQQCRLEILRNPLLLHGLYVTWMSRCSGLGRLGASRAAWIERRTSHRFVYF